MKTAFLATSVMFLVGASHQLFAQKCLEYGPTVMLNGRIHSREFAGPPNYESVRKGDRKETALLLTLVKNTCTTGNSSDILEFPEEKIGEVQMVIRNDAHWKIVRKLKGKLASVTGTLFHAHTGHHRTNVLIDVVSIKAAKNKPNG